MAYEVTDACDGWATRQRLSMTLTNRDGQDVELISDYATWESKDGLSMRFRMRQTTDTAVTEQAEGEAKLDSVGGPGTIHYTVPEDKHMPMPAGTVFPMAHTEAIIAAAEAGKRFLALPIFDGTGDRGAQDSSIAIANWGPSGTAPYPGACRTCRPAGCGSPFSTATRSLSATGRRAVRTMRSGCSISQTASPTTCIWIFPIS